MIDQVAGSGVGLLDRDRIASLRRTVVINEHDSRPGADCDFPDQAIVGFSIAQNPPPAVNIDYRRQDIDGAGRANDPYRYRSGWTNREGGVLNLGAWLANRYRLCAHQDGPSLVRSQAVYRGRTSQPIDELLGVRLQPGPDCVGCHECSPASTRTVIRLLLSCRSGCLICG